MNSTAFLQKLCRFITENAIHYKDAASPTQLEEGFLGTESNY